MTASFSGYGSAGTGFGLDGVNAGDLLAVPGRTAQFPVSEVEKVYPGPANEPVVLEAGDNGKTVLLGVGREMRIRVADPRDGGYVLQDPVFDRSKLAFTGRVALPHPGCVGCAGNFGLVEYRFKGMAVGKTRVSIKAKRPWETGKPGIEVFKANIDVQRLFYIMEMPGDRKGSAYCRDSFKELEARAAEIKAMDASEETKALLLKMNDNARRSVELACGVVKPEPYDYCADSFKKLAENAAEIQALDAGPETKALLLKINDNARRSVELVCGSK